MPGNTDSSRQTLEMERQQARDRLRRRLAIVSADETIGNCRAKAEKKEREQAAEREEHERQKEAETASRLAEAQAELIKNSRELHRTIRERIEQRRDDECYIDPARIGKTMGSAEAMEYNRAEAEAFMRDNPDAYYPSESNFAALGSYFERNHVHIVSRRTLAAAVKKLREIRLVVDRPTPSKPAPSQDQQSKPAVTLKPAPVPVNASRQKASDADAGATVGIDPATGRERSYTAREIARMSALEYRKCFKIVKSDLVLPSRNW